MGYAVDFGNLTQDIVASYNVRVKGIETIVKDTRTSAKNTQDMIKRFHAENREMSAAQAKTLAAFMADLTQNVGGLLGGLHTEHEEMSAEQAEALTGFMADLTKNVGSLMKGFQKEHKNMSAALKASLDKNTKDIETFVKNKLQDFSNAHAEMSEGMKNHLAKYVANLVNGSKQLLGMFHKDREKMAAHWQAMSATLAQKRGVTPVEMDAQEEVKTVDEAVKKPAAGKAGTMGKGKKK